MARSFRFYQKKRGNRRTGSPMLGSMGEAAFWAVFLLLGCAGAVAVFYNLIVPEWRVNHEFVQTTCSVNEKRVDERQSKDGTLYRPDINIVYEIDGVTYNYWRFDIHRAYTNSKKDAEETIEPFEVGKRYPCWYDPMDPENAVLVRGYRWWIWLVLTVPASFIMIGAGGLIYTFLHWGKSAERRALVNQQVGDRDYFLGNGRDAFPSIPKGADLTNSPGIRLRYRLPMAASPGWVLFGLFIFCLLWNAIITVFVVLAVRNHLAGIPDWFLTIFSLFFMLVGLGAIFMFFRQLLITTGVGPTLLEISEHPLSPGGQYRLFLSQSGRLNINSLTVSLECEESASYRQGTNSRTENRGVFHRELLQREAFQVESGFPFETEIEMEMPEKVMHSFKSEHNEIKWFLSVEGDVAHRPVFKRRFTIIVRPAIGEASP